MVGLRARRNQRGPSEDKNSYQRGPMSPHWNSPFALGLPRRAFARTIGKFGPRHIPGWKNVERTGEVTSTSTASSLALSSGPDSSIWTLSLRETIGPPPLCCQSQIGGRPPHLALDRFCRDTIHLSPAP